MGRERSEKSLPDLFSTVVGREDSSPPPKPPATGATLDSALTRRHVLPTNLHNAVTHLNDEELDLLHEATLGEMKRRGRFPQTIGAGSAQSPPRPPNLETKRQPSKGKIPHQRKVDLVEGTLTRGQVNAVRSAFKAGISPARIARQFGLSQSNVRKALASDDSKR